MAFNTTTAKNILTSTTFWAAVLGAFTMLFPTIFTKLGVTNDNVTTVSAHIVQGISFLGVVYGRLTANQPVTLTAPLNAPKAG